MSVGHFVHVLLTVYGARRSTCPRNHPVPCVTVTVIKLGLRMKNHRKEVDSFTAGTQTRASRTRESSITHKSAITDHAVEENHVIDWNSAEVVAR